MGDLVTGSVAADAAMDPLALAILAAALWGLLGFVIGRTTR